MTKPLLFGTANQAKRDHIRAVLKSLPLKILSLKDLEIDLQVEETGATPLENAAEKARAYHTASGLPVFSIDVGLSVDKFPPNKQPGVFVRRLHGREATDDEMIAYYTRELESVGGTSNATWDLGIVLIVSPDLQFTGTVQEPTQLTSTPSNTRIPGAPLSAIQIHPETGTYLSEMTWEKRVQLQNRRDQYIRTFIEQHLNAL